MSTNLTYQPGQPKGLIDGRVYVVRVKKNTYKGFMHVTAKMTKNGILAIKEKYIINPEKILGWYREPLNWVEVN